MNAATIIGYLILAGLAAVTIYVIADSVKRGTKGVAA